MISCISVQQEEQQQLVASQILTSYQIFMQYGFGSR
jgi:hypothetical protein